MGVLRAKVVALATLATLATVAMLAACAPAAEGGPATAAPPSAETSTTPSLSVDPTESPEPTPTPKPLLTDGPGTDGDWDGGDGDGDYYGEQPSGPSTWTYRYAPTDGYPTYFPEVLPPTNDDGTVGSGCTPSDSGTLPDGVWRVHLLRQSYQEWPAWIEIDVVCSYSFQYPNPPEDVIDEGYGDLDLDYIVTNNDTTSWVLPIAEDAIGYGSSRTWAPVTWEQTWVGCGTCGTWIWINGGEVTELAWPYTWTNDMLADWKNGNS